MSEYLPGWTVQLDPSSIAPDRTMLDLNSGPIGVESVDWGDAAVTSSETQEGQYGNSVADFIIPNRTITLKLFLGADDSGTEETARANLQQKLALLQREGGQILRQRDGGPKMYADIVSVSPTIPDVYGETGGVEPDVSLALECLPDFYGDEIILDTTAATGHCNAILKQSGSQAAIEGDYPSRCRIVVTDTSGNDQHGLAWGMRSRHYDSASTAALAYEAEALTPLNGAAIAALTGASGGHTVSLSVPVASVWVPILATNLLAGTKLTHQGTYRVRARCYSATGTPQFQLVWGPGSLSVPVTNDAATLPGAGAFYMLDLGTIRLDPQAVGANAWVGAIQVQTVATAIDAQVDEVFLEPLDESAGQLAYVPVPSASVLSASGVPGAAVDDASFGTTVWSNPTFAEAQDGSGAFASGASRNVSSHYLDVTSFGFAIPSGSTIQGIVMNVVRLGGADAVFDSRVRIIKGGVVESAVDKANTGLHWPNTYETATYGSPTDLWGQTWTPADINATNFGVAISAIRSGAAVGNALIDYVSATVYFTLSSGFTVAQDAVVYAGKVTELRTEGMSRTQDGTVYGPVTKVIGDLPRLPPSGIEERPVELYVNPSRGDLDTVADSGLDGFTVQVKYRPCWMGRP